jgi:hypothetical protein
MKKATYPSFLFIVMVLKLISYVFLEKKKKRVFRVLLSLHKILFIDLNSTIQVEQHKCIIFIEELTVLGKTKYTRNPPCKLKMI